MVKIKDIHAREILDSRGNPTVEVDVILDNNIKCSASIPSGASTGVHEALELRDNNLNRYNGKGVLAAVKNVNTIIRSRLIGEDPLNQELIDKILLELDGTKDKSKLGANAILCVSLAVLKCSAKYLNKELYEYFGGNNLPKCMMNILNGGCHALNKLDFQEFMIVPFLDNFEDNLRMGSEVFHSLEKILAEKKLECGVGDEGGFAPKINSNSEAIELIVLAIKKTNYILGKDIYIALDVAASQFYKDGYYILENKKYTKKELVDYYVTLIKKYPIISIEDGMAEDDYEGWKLLTDALGKKIQLVGDDLFATNKRLLQKGIELGIANAILLKLNQVGTVTETIQTINLAQKNNYKTIISHRSGETEDSFIVDFAVGLNLGQIKAGSLSRGERISKYNRLLRISETLK